MKTEEGRRGERRGERREEEKGEEGRRGEEREERRREKRRGEERRGEYRRAPPPRAQSLHYTHRELLEISAQGEKVSKCGVKRGNCECWFIGDAVKGVCV